MKHFLVIILALTGTLALGAGKADPEKPLYQNIVPGIPTGNGKRVGGLWGPVTPIAPKTESQSDLRKRFQLERDNEQATIGMWLKIAGLGLICLGAFGHFSTSIPFLKSWGSTIATLGGVGYVYGRVLQKEAQYGPVLDWIMFAALIGFIVWLLWKNRKTSLSHHIPQNIKDRIADKLKNNKPDRKG